MKPSIPLALLVLSAVTILVYANSLHNEFVYDDENLIVKNNLIHSIDNIPKFFTKPLFKTSNFYRPIQSISYTIDYHYWKLNPFGYHLTNTLLHLGNAILIFCVVILLSSRFSIAFLAGLLFAVHPIHTEAVTYISGRADPLAALFCLVSFALFIKYINLAHPFKRCLSYICSIVFYACSLLSKEIAIIFPLVFILYEIGFVRTRKESIIKTVFNYKYTPFLFLVVIYSILRIKNLYIPNPEDMYSITSDFTLFQRLLTALYVTLSYIRLLFLPFGLHMERTIRPILSVFDIRLLFSLMILVGIGLFILKSLKNNKLVFFGAMWFFINLIPVSNIIPLNAFIAEHWLYLPSTGFFIILSTALIKLTLIRPFKQVAILLIIVMIGLYSLLTIKQNQIWKDSITFYQYTLRFSPERPRIRTNLGSSYSDKGLYQEAIKEYQEAIRFNPRYAEPHTNLGNLYLKMARYDDAIEEYKIAISLDPALVSSYNNLAVVYFKKGRYIEAINMSKQALRLSLDDYEIWFNLAEACRMNQDFDNAVEAYRKTIRYNPVFFTAHLNLGSVLLMNNKNEEAINEYKTALKINPNSSEAYFNLGVAYAKLENFHLAKNSWEKALELNPALKQARDNLDKLRQMGY